MAKSEHFFPLGEITKCRRVNRKTREESSSSEESEAGEDNDADDSDEQSESDDRGKHGQDLHKQRSKKYGKGMAVFLLIFSENPTPTTSLIPFWTSVGKFWTCFNAKYQ